MDVDGLLDVEEVALERATQEIVTKPVISLCILLSNYCVRVYSILEDTSSIHLPGLPYSTKQDTLQCNP